MSFSTAGRQFESEYKANTIHICDTEFSLWSFKSLRNAAGTPSDRRERRVLFATGGQWLCRVGHDWSDARPFLIGGYNPLNRVRMYLVGQSIALRSSTAREAEKLED